MRVAVCVILFAALMAAWTVAPASGLTLEATLDPDANSSRFHLDGSKSITIEYTRGGALSEFLRDTGSRLEFEVGPEDPGVQQLTASLNEKIRSDGSRASVDDLTVLYRVLVDGGETYTSINFYVNLSGNITGYVIDRDRDETTVDLGWRGLGSDESIVMDGGLLTWWRVPTERNPATLQESKTVDGIDINIPLNTMRDHYPAIYDLVRGTAAAAELSKGTINSSSILAVPMTEWNYSFGPQRDPVRDDIISWNYGSLWAHGFYLTPAVVRPSPAIPGEISYNMTLGSSGDQGIIFVPGLAILDVREGVEAAVVTPTDLEVEIIPYYPPKPDTKAHEGNFTDPGVEITPDDPAGAVADEGLEPTAIYAAVALAVAGAGVFAVFMYRIQSNRKK